MSTPLIRLDRVRKEFGRQVLAVEDMTLTINQAISSASSARRAVASPRCSR